MNIFYETAGKITLQALAKSKGISLKQLEAEIQTTIDHAWGRSGDGGSTNRLQTELFPDGKPTPAEFVYVLSRLC